jgi:bifunctional ADP-heptose synthase (sugar kinase/adenylyltransferase)
MASQATVDTDVTTTFVSGAGASSTAVPVGTSASGNEASSTADVCASVVVSPLSTSSITESERLQQRLIGDGVRWY